MFSFRGDAHKFYLKLKKLNRTHLRYGENRELKEIREIQDFYKGIETQTLLDIYYKMIKEKNGSGIIPIFVSAGPWLLFIFSKQLQELLFKDGSMLWLTFIVVYVTTLIMSVILHFHEKAWASLHIEIIQDILKSREEQK
ncbi:hypothetical protein SAMN05877753_10884 [Bacillus oleivorans]|uniref:Uncharacterized protein n=1 Tax=Bacillus oleivorans TaxID=1448271 RepID=A0A285D3V5_9BACI|nr:hypothetical protein [Bacillus oleivorans]SNX73996.1 hypothetical protein SAMN05877753_10884 [Bacillus oleivorans]